MFIGGTTLLTEVYTPAERNKVQALNDFMVWGTVSVASLSAGMLQNLVGWDAVNLAILAPVLIAFTAALLLRVFRARHAVDRTGITRLPAPRSRNTARITCLRNRLTVRFARPPVLGRRAA